MMSADQLKAYYQRRGEWQEADKESISKLSNPATFDRSLREARRKPIVEQQVDPKYLSTLAAARYEAETFMSRHPEWFCTPANGEVMRKYMEDNSLILTVENFEHAFEVLKRQGKILPTRESMVKMSDAELKKFYEANGTPRYDGHGRLLGYDLPEVYTETPTDDYNRPRAKVTQSRMPLHPEDARRDPSKREYAMWDSDRQRDWLIARGYWGGDLPEFLR
jgi:hypothetical protein